MKIFVGLFFLFVTSLFPKQSIYPIGFSFDESDFRVFTVDVIKHTKESTQLTIAYKNSEEEYLFLQSQPIGIKECDLKNIKDLKKLSSLGTGSKLCKRAFSFIGKYDKTIKNNGFEIFLYNNKPNLCQSIALVFKKEKYLFSLLTAYVDNKCFDEFEPLLLAIKDEVVPKMSVKKYIELFEENFKKYQINTALSYLISAIILEPNNKELGVLYKKLKRKEYSVTKEILYWESNTNKVKK